MEDHRDFNQMCRALVKWAGIQSQLETTIDVLSEMSKCDGVYPKELYSRYESLPKLRETAEKYIDARFWLQKWFDYAKDRLANGDVISDYDEETEEIHNLYIVSWSDDEKLTTDIMDMHDAIFGRHKLKHCIDVRLSD